MKYLGTYLGTILHNTHDMMLTTMLPGVCRGGVRVAGMPRLPNSSAGPAIVVGRCTVRGMAQYPPVRGVPAELWSVCAEYMLTRAQHHSRDASHQAFFKMLAEAAPPVRKKGCDVELC